jgi:8-oxo-dGTP diphosphatase
LRRRREPDAAGVEPEYACGLISDSRGWWLLQLRPSDKPLAPGRLTCFGGRREDGETAEACLRRELDEELGWCPALLSPSIELRDGPRFIALFFRGRLDIPVTRLRVEAGDAAILAPPDAIPGLPVSPWHSVVLEMARVGGGIVDLATPSPNA